MRIIEFAGVTGCGKSTLCREWAGRSGAGQRTVAYRDVFTGLRVKRLLVPLFRADRKFREFEKALGDFAAEYTGVSENALTKLKVLYIAASRLKKGSRMVLDEGFAQLLTSVAHLQPLRDDEKLDAATQLLRRFDITVVDCRIDGPEAVRRIRGRNTGDRFNAIKGDGELLEALETKQRNIDTAVRKIEKVITVRTDRPAEELCGELESLLEAENKR